MREIKFRAYVKPIQWVVPVEEIDFHAKMVEVDLAHGQGDFSDYSFDEVELMQYTGLKDKGGVEIYEGDVVKCLTISEAFAREYISDVFLEDGCWLVHENETCDVELFLYSNSNPTKTSLTEIEVIGNLYENPELLKGAQQCAKNLQS